MTGQPAASQLSQSLQKSYTRRRLARPAVPRRGAAPGPAELADLIAAERVVGRILAEPGAGSSGFHVADELVFQSVPGSVRGSPNRGITLALKPVTAVIRSPAIVTTSSP